MHKKTRSIIERCNGLLKSRFRCLLKHRVLHYSPTTASRIINACVVLHNMSIHFNNPIPEDEGTLEDIDYGMSLNTNNDENPVMTVNPLLAAGRRSRLHLINNHFRDM